MEMAMCIGKRTGVQLLRFDRSFEAFVRNFACESSQRNILCIAPRYSDLGLQILMLKR